MTEEADFVLAIDIGGTKIAAALVDAHGRVSERHETPTLAHEGRAGILSRVAAVGRQALARAPRGTVHATGAASAGQIDIHSGRVSYATENLPGWNQLDLTGALEGLFGLPATADNDVNAMAVAEMQYGAGRGSREVFCAMVGTGIGGALIQNGQLYHGGLGGAGEFGHVSIQAFGGRPCNCGGTGCVEVYGSSRAVLQDLLAAAGPEEVKRRLGVAAGELTIHDLARAFHDPLHADWSALHQTVASAADALGAGLATVANLLSPELIVVAGSIQLFGASYLQAVQASLRRRAMVPRQNTALGYSLLGPDPALLGAALLARQRFGLRGPRAVR